MRSKAARLEEEKQNVERKMQARLDEEEENSRAAQEASEQRMAKMEEELRQSSSSTASKPHAGSQPPAMAAPGRLTIFAKASCKGCLICTRKDSMIDKMLSSEVQCQSVEQRLIVFYLLGLYILPARYVIS